MNEQDGRDNDTGPKQENQEEGFFFGSAEEENPYTEVEDSEPQTGTRSGTGDGLDALVQDITGSGIGDGQVQAVPPAGSGGSMVRMLSLLVLLVALGGGAFYLLGDNMTGSELPAQELVKAQAGKIKVPQRVSEEEQSKVKEEVVPADKVVAANTKTVAASVKQQPAKKVAKVVPAQEKSLSSKQPYTIKVGEYLLSWDLKAAQNKVRELGFSSSVESIGKKTVDMTRLQVGVYDKDVAQTKLSNLKKMSNSAFMMAQGKKVAVYAGSYYVLDRARVAADKLYRLGVHTTEVPIKVQVPVKTLYVGSFASQEEALKVAARVKQAGLSTKVIQR